MSSTIIGTDSMLAIMKRMKDDGYITLEQYAAALRRSKDIPEDMTGDIRVYSKKEMNMMKKQESIKRMCNNNVATKDKY